MSVEFRSGMIADRKAAFQNRVSEIKGHSEDIRKKLLMSAALGGAIATVNWVGASAFALNEPALIYSHLPETLYKGLILGLTYGVHVGASVANLIQEGRLLKNPRIELNQNFGSTLAYHGLEKINILKEKKGKRSMAAVLASAIGSLSWTIPRESAFISLALLSNDKMQELTVLKSAQALFAFSQVGAAEVILRTFGREKKVR
mgnify:CR=1 FL=1